MVQASILHLLWLQSYTVWVRTSEHGCTIEQVRREQGELAGAGPGARVQQSGGLGAV